VARTIGIVDWRIGGHVAQLARGVRDARGGPTDPLLSPEPAATELQLKLLPLDQRSARPDGSRSTWPTTEQTHHLINASG